MNDVEFQQLIANCGISDDDLAHILKLSRSTVDRWKRGVTSPHPLARASIEKAISKYKAMVAQCQSTTSSAE